MSGFELTAEERRKVQVNVDRFERLSTAVKASYDELVPILERYQEHTWQSPAETQEESDRTRDQTGIGRLYDLCWDLADHLRVLSGEREVFGPEEAVKAGYVKAPAA